MIPKDKIELTTLDAIDYVAGQSSRPTMETKISELDFDSLDKVEVIMEIENKLKVKISDDDFDYDKFNPKCEFLVSDFVADVEKAING